MSNGDFFTAGDRRVVRSRQDKAYSGEEPLRNHRSTITGSPAENPLPSLRDETLGAGMGANPEDKKAESEVSEKIGQLKSR
jgi:hypothetical protein